jgi:hypothetical protein
MSKIRVPTEVELVFEVMPCNAMRTELEPGAAPHPCTYFRKWGTYHSYDYTENGPPPDPGIIWEGKMMYMGRARLVPELLSGCRKAPIITVGINPNLPGWYENRRGSLNPLFDDYKQYAHYFRYRAVSKLEIPPADYQNYGGGQQDTPFSNFTLAVPADNAGHRVLEVQRQDQTMYRAYQSLLDSLAEEMGWPDHQLVVGEDLAYGNMVACPSARWTTTVLPADPKVPPMTVGERNGIVSECFRERKYFLRQLFQSLPAVLLVFSQSTANALIGELQSNFIADKPQPGEPLDELMKRHFRLHYGDLPNGDSLEARVIFAPHITGSPGEFEAARKMVLDQLVAEAKAGRLNYNPVTKHLARTRGSCVFCPMLEIGKCDYEDELVSIDLKPALTADSPATDLMAEKEMQNNLMTEFVKKSVPVEQVWGTSDDIHDEPPSDG